LAYQIILPQFEGPFDLLLFFIERDELDIYDIPIHKLTNDFLEYIRTMEQLNIELASEFILVAATLMRIKARTLLPRKELDEQGNEIDPREELVNRLLEYKRYNSVVADLHRLEYDRQGMEKRGNVLKEQRKLAEVNSVEAELETVTLYKLMKVFHRVTERYTDRNLKVQHTIVRFNYNMKERKGYLLGLVKKTGRADFEAIFGTCENRVHAIFTFLALLELVQLREIGLQVGKEGFNNFWLLAA
jgi:segregation and condensation protein A